jgi:hypothetical protein
MRALENENSELLPAGVNSATFQFPLLLSHVGLIRPTSIGTARNEQWRN